ncbi:MAG: peptidylprolyl isomerase [Leptothrix sp. (in: b-proteobacteria)]
MFDFVRRHNRLLQAGLALVIFPSFIAFGIQGYQRFSGDSLEVAKVGGRAVSQSEWDAAHRAQIERLRAQSPTADIKLFDTPAMRLKVLESLVRERVLLAAAQDLLLAPTDQRLQRLFRNDPQFASVRNADGSVRKELLEMQGMSSDQFAARLRQDLALRQVTLGMGASVLANPAVSSMAIESFFQQREIQVAYFKPQEFLAKVSASDADIQAYYDDAKHAAQFLSAEQVAVEYVVLDLPAVTASITVSDDDLRKYYDENATRYEQPQERRARHILVKVDAKAPADVKAKAKAKADDLLAQLQKNRSAFADLARKQSDDPGSAAQGGDLDWVARGAMVKPFEDAVFALKKGDLSGVVETEFGFHLIEVTEVRGGDKRAFASVRPEIEAEVKKQLAQKRYAEMAEQFTNLVEQEDNLKPVADKLKLVLHKTEAFRRNAPPAADAVLANPKLAEALFQEQNLNGKRNLEPIEIGANQLVSVRVLDHQPARKQGLAEVSDRVRTQVLNDKASQLAVTEGQAKLKAWKAQPDAATLLPALTVSRTQDQKQAKEVVDAAIRATADTLPAWTGVDLGARGYAVIKVNKVLPSDASISGDPARVAAQYGQLWAQAEADAYQQALSKRYKAEISDKAKAVSSAPVTAAQ